MIEQYVKGECIFTRINECKKQYEYLAQDIETDVIIVGGGVTGSILGHYFSKNNIKSVVLEKFRIAHGSTSITTSLLQYELDGNALALKPYTSVENVIKSYNLGLKALDEIKEFIDKTENNFEYKQVDSLLYTSKNLEKKEIEQEYQLRKENDFSVELVEQLEGLSNFDMKIGLISKGGGATVDPYKFTHSLLDEGYKNGLKVYENTEVMDVEYSDEGVTAYTRYGHKVKGKIIIVATGYNTKLFTNRTFGTKSTTFNIATKPIEGLDNILKEIIIRDNKDIYNYLRATDDNRLIYGGEDINWMPDINNEKLCMRSYDLLDQKLKTMFPNLKIDIDYKYCGAFASTKDDLGFIGKDPDNEKLWYCLGYGANGILFAILGGMMLSKMYSGEIDEDLLLFKVDRFD